MDKEEFIAKVKDIFAEIGELKLVCNCNLCRKNIDVALEKIWELAQKIQPEMRT